jgi:hypothetical protein
VAVIAHPLLASNSDDEGMMSQRAVQMAVLVVLLVVVLVQRYF